MKYYCDDQRHLICLPYTVVNLHKMASIFNIKRCWFHGGRDPHYDIPKRRIAEVTTKCILVSSKELLTMIKAAVAEVVLRARA